MIGRKFSDQAVQNDMKQWSFTVVDDNTKPKVQVEYKVNFVAFILQFNVYIVITKAYYLM